MQRLLQSNLYELNFTTASYFASVYKKHPGEESLSESKNKSITSKLF